MSPQYEATIADAFVTFLEKGYVYRGLKPVYWCIVDTTALAEAEVEYEDHTSPSIWVRYKVAQQPAPPLRQEGDFYALVWTTTPWTLPASKALAFNPALKYVLACDSQSNDTYIVAEDLIASASAATGLRLVEGSGSYPGTTFASMKFQHPFLDAIVPGVLGEHVTLEQGSGCLLYTSPSPRD